MTEKNIIFDLSIFEQFKKLTDEELMKVNGGQALTVLPNGDTVNVASYYHYVYSNWVTQ